MRNIFSSTPLRASVLVALSLVAFGMASAGTVTLQNGDRLTGQVTSVQDGLLKLSTTYAGEISIDFGQIVSVHTDAPVALRITDGTVLEGRLVPTGKGQTVVSGENAQTVALKSISQIAPDAARLEAKDQKPEEPKKKWGGSIDVGVSMQEGSTDTVDANLAFEAIRKWRLDTLTLYVKSGYGEVNSQVNTRSLEAGAKEAHEFSKKIYGFASASGLHDPGRKLELRLQADTGVGYKLLESEKRSLALEGGLNFTHERWNTFSIRDYDEAKETYRAASPARIQTYIGGLDPQPWSILETFENLRGLQDLLTGGVTQETSSGDTLSLMLAAGYKETLFGSTVLTEKLILLPSLEKFGDYRVTSDFALETPISEKLNLRLSLRTEYQSETGDGDSQLDNRFILGLRYRF